MGVPAFYRWLVEKCPLAVVDVLEEAPIVVNGVTIPIDTSSANPNGIEFDNLYLDMNGIIHPCFHPENQPAPESYEDVFKAVFKYIDRIFTMVRPRKLIYMAIDGVAPRAKMNQQRARRFRAAKDAADAAATMDKLKSAFDSESKTLSDTEKARMLDSNVITPGTEFMAALSSALNYYIHLRLNNDPGWHGIKVILSDANVPGEGEHKIMSYIRLQRNLLGFDPNTHHCLYGLDADLIMLALATHEVHFTILREDIRTLQQNSKNKKFTPSRVQIYGKNKEAFGPDGESNPPMQLFQFLNIWVLRHYLQHDLRIPNSVEKLDLERYIDDFVFMCLFVGNDFLPHLPSLEINEGAIDLLMHVYKEEFSRMGGYLTDSFQIDLKRVEHFIEVVASHENAIFRRRCQVQKDRETLSPSSLNIIHGSGGFSMGTSRRKNASMKFSSQSSKCFVAKEMKNPAARLCHVKTLASTGPGVDKVKLGEEGWKERYYTEKFEVRTEEELEKFKKHAVLKYVEGICWVMHYYYGGVCSWQWFYPYHYAPFASDFQGLDQLDIHFTLGEPFKPFDQLMGVLPAASAHALPLFYRKLMTDPLSDILDFYPTDFELDMNGKRHAWQAVCKLPFIKESRLLGEIVKVEHTLTDEEKRRNSLGLDVLFVNLCHPLAKKMVSFFERKKHHRKLFMAKVKKKIDPEISGGMNGYMYISDKTGLQKEIHSPIEGLRRIAKNRVVTVFYKIPPFHAHISRPPKGVIMPGKSISKRDISSPPILWHEKTTIRGRLFADRPIPRSVSGPCLAKLARQLVLKYYTGKKQENLDAAIQNGDMFRSHSCLLEQTTEKESNPRSRKKRKQRDSGDGICTGTKKQK